MSSLHSYGRDDCYIVAKAMPAVYMMFVWLALGDQTHLAFY